MPALSPRRAVLLGLAILAILLPAVALSRLLGPPSLRPEQPPAVRNGAAFERVVVELLLRQGRLSRRTGPLTITEAELNAFLQRYVEARRLGLSGITVRLADGWVELTGRATLARLLGQRAGAALLPQALGDLEVWPGIAGRLSVKPGELRLAVEAATLGRQAVPPGWLGSLLGLDPERSLRWSIPRVVERVAVEPGRLVIYTRAPAAARGPAP